MRRRSFLSLLAAPFAMAAAKLAPAAPNPVVLEPCGLDIDGNVRRIADLSYGSSWRTNCISFPSRADTDLTEVLADAG